MSSDLTLTPELLKDVAKLPPRRRNRIIRRIGEIEWGRCADDIFYWLDETKHPWPYVYTIDNHPMYLCKLCTDKAEYSRTKRQLHLQHRHSIKCEVDREIRGYFTELPTTRPFPLYDYMRPIIETWLTENLILVPKSRDMVATWTCVTMYTWDTLFHNGRQNIFQSENASKTLELVRRAWIIYKNQPKFLRDVHKATFGLGSTRSGALQIPSLDSEILGFPQGPDQIRQLHPTGVFQDESAYQIQAGDAFTAIKPSIMDGGRFTAISSAAPGWFQLACLDNLEVFDG